MNDGFVAALIVGLAYVSYIAYQKKQAVDSLSWSLQGVQFVPGTNGNNQLILTLQVTNSVNQSLTFDSFNGYAVIQNVQLAQIAYNTTTTINYGVNTITVPVTFNTNGLAADALAIVTALAAGNTSDPITIQGTLNVYGVDIAINESIPVNL